MTSNGPCASKPSGSIALTSSALICSRACSLRTVAVTRAPAIWPSWTAAMPTPPAAPWTSRRSPHVRPAWVNRASWAVVKTSGTPPAETQSSSSGIGITSRSLTAISSACPPPPTTAITRSPGSKRCTPGPVSATSPGELEAEDVGRRAGRRGVAALHLQHVGAVDARRHGRGRGSHRPGAPDRGAPRGRRPRRGRSRLACGERIATFLTRAAAAHQPLCEYPQTSWHTRYGRVTNLSPVRQV